MRMRFGVWLNGWVRNNYFCSFASPYTSHYNLIATRKRGKGFVALAMTRKYQKKAGKPAPKGGGIPRGMSRTLNLACDVFLMRRGLKGPNSFRFSHTRNPSTH